MSGFILTPEQFQVASKDEQQQAYQRLFDHWLNKGELKTALADKLHGIAVGHSEGAAATNESTEPVRQFIFKFYWQHKHSGYVKISLKAIDRAQTAEFPDCRLETSTVKHWFRAMNKTWKEQSWNETEESFLQFDQRVRYWRNNH